MSNPKGQVWKTLDNFTLKIKMEEGGGGGGLLQQNY